LYCEGFDYFFKSDDADVRVVAAARCKLPAHVASSEFYDVAKLVRQHRDQLAKAHRGSLAPLSRLMVMFDVLCRHFRT
jgi:hypothetical protein